MHRQHLYTTSTQAEAREQWKALESNPRTPRDQRGPRGRQRLLVPIKTEVVGYRGVEQEKAFAQEAKLGKKLTDAQVDAKMALLVQQGLAQHPCIYFLLQVCKHICICMGVEVQKLCCTFAVTLSTPKVQDAEPDENLGDTATSDNFDKMLSRADHAFVGGGLNEAHSHEHAGRC